MKGSGEERFPTEGIRLKGERRTVQATCSRGCSKTSSVLEQGLHPLFPWSWQTVMKGGVYLGTAVGTANVHCPLIKPKQSVGAQRPSTALPS